MAELVAFLTIGSVLIQLILEHRGMSSWLDRRYQRFNEGMVMTHRRCSSIAHAVSRCPTSATPARPRWAIPCNCSLHYICTYRNQHSLFIFHSNSGSFNIITAVRGNRIVISSRYSKKEREKRAKNKKKKSKMTIDVLPQSRALCQWRWNLLLNNFFLYFFTVCFVIFHTLLYSSPSLSLSLSLLWIDSITRWSLPFFSHI